MSCHRATKAAKSAGIDVIDVHNKIVVALHRVSIQSSRVSRSTTIIIIIVITQYHQGKNKAERRGEGSGGRIRHKNCRHCRADNVSAIFGMRTSDRLTNGKGEIRILPSFLLRTN